MWSEEEKAFPAVAYFLTNSMGSYRHRSTDVSIALNKSLARWAIMTACAFGSKPRCYLLVTHLFHRTWYTCSLASKVSIHLQKYLRFISCKKFPRNVQVATFHGDDSGVPPQDPKTPSHRAPPPEISALILSLRPYSHTKFTCQ